MNKYEFQALLPGLVTSIAIALLGVVMAEWLPFMGSVLIALIIGVIAGNTILKDTQFTPGLKFSEKKILETAIVFMGFGFQTSQLNQLGFSTMGWIVLSVILVLGFSYVIGKWMGVSERLSLLVGAGSAICGSSAIAAISPIVKGSDEETGLSLAVINLLGVVGLVSFPILVSAMDYSTIESSVFIGGILQSLGHVVAASYTAGEEIGEWATVVKMMRIFLMIPLLIVVFFLQRTKKELGQEKMKFPVFILLFIAAFLLAQFVPIEQSYFNYLSKFGDHLLTIAMAAIGANIRINPLLKISKKGLLHGTAVFAFQILFFVALIAVVGF